jgi:hypothetical protein
MRLATAVCSGVAILSCSGPRPTFYGERDLDDAGAPPPEASIGTDGYTGQSSKGTSQHERENDASIPPSGHSFSDAGASDQLADASLESGDGLPSIDATRTQGNPANSPAVSRDASFEEQPSPADLSEPDSASTHSFSSSNTGESSLIDACVTGASQLLGCGLNGRGEQTSVVRCGDMG